MQWTGDNIRELWNFTGSRDVYGPSRDDPDHLVIHTIEGDMKASIGAWIVRGMVGEIYPVRADIFAASYELAHPVVAR